MSQSMLELFESARRVSVPLVLVRTTDQTAVVEKLKQASVGHPMLQWDVVRGLVAAPVEIEVEVVEEGKKVRKKKVVNKGAEMVKAAKLDLADTINFTDALRAANGCTQGAIVFAYNVQRQLVSSEPGAIAQNVQAVANLRDSFKANFRMLVLLAPALTVPMELEQDVVILDDALPDEQALRTIVKETYAAGKLKPPTDEVQVKAVEALSGLSAFAAEQVAAMSLRETGVDVLALWERKRVAIEQVPGLQVWRGKETFADIIGQAALKAHLRRRIAAKRPIGVVVWIDEIDKALANVEQDTSGVRMYQLLKLLTEMENNEWPGFVGVGVAGGGKSLIAKAVGNEAGVPTMGLDLGATESKYVGESEANLLRVLQVIKAVGRGNAYFVATSNAATVMRPELQRRFTDGMWMFDLMTKAERMAAWGFYLKRYGLAEQVIPRDDAWTGAEIRNCCRYAYETSCSLVVAAKIIVPMAQSRGPEIEMLRHYAHGKFLDVNDGDTYAYEPEPMEEPLKAGRAIALPEAVLEMVQDVPKRQMN